MAESEAQAIRFTIDHYEPRSARPELEDLYTNLIYACDECNIRKGDRYPSPEARSKGYRFFRSDEDRRSDHFRSHDIRVEGITGVGRFTEHCVDLNRHSLLKLRRFRKRLAECEQQVAEGLLALRSFSIDQLPRELRTKALRAVQDVLAIEIRLAEEIDRILREAARSTLIDPDPNAEEAKRERLKELRKIEAMVPGDWRAPRPTKRPRRR